MHTTALRTLESCLQIWIRLWSCVSCERGDVSYASYPFQSHACMLSQCYDVLLGESVQRHPSCLYKIGSLCDAVLCHTIVGRLPHHDHRVPRRSFALCNDPRL